jgi:hypothetical protein
MALEIRRCRLGWASLELPLSLPEFPEAFDGKSLVVGFHLN